MPNITMTFWQRINPIYRIKTTKIRIKVVYSFLFIILCLVVMTSFNFFMVVVMRDNTNKIFYVETPVADLAASCSKQIYKVKLVTMQVLESNADYAEINARFNAESAYLLKRLNEFNTYIGTNSESIEQLKNIRQQNDQFRVAFHVLIDAYIAMGTQKALLTMSPADVIVSQKKLDNLKRDADKKYTALEQSLVRIETEYNSRVNKKIISIQQLQFWFTYASLIISLFAIVIGIIMALLIYGSIIKPLQVLSGYVKKFSGGTIPAVNLAQFNLRDELGELAVDFQDMCEGMKFIVSDIKASSNNMNAAVKISIANFEQISDGTCSQSALLEEATGMVMELSRSINDISKFINSSYDLSRETLDSASHGDSAVKSTIHEINEIHNISKTSLQIVDSLAEAYKRINNITDMISNIADQTNMLALNAAIEAARAGDQGKGFAVVSDQVAKLADRSAKSAKEIEELIGSIQKEINKITKVGERSAVQVEQGVKSAESSGSALNAIIGNVEKVNKNIEDISIISNTQVELSRRINDAIQGVAATSEETAASSENSYEQARSLGSIADKLEDIVKQFIIESEEISPSGEK